MSGVRKGYRNCQKCNKSRAERFFKPRGRICKSCQSSGSRASRHDKRMQEVYGLKPGEFDLLWEAQGFKCAICGRTPPKGRYFDLDHDHSNDLARGIICPADNRKVLKYARNDPARLRAAADYLEDPPAQRVLGERRYQGET